MEACEAFGHMIRPCLKYTAECYRTVLQGYHDSKALAKRLQAAGSEISKMTSEQSTNER